MQAGSLKHVIELQRETEALNEYRVPVKTWVTYSSGRASMKTVGVSEFLKSFGESSTETAVFTIRWIPGVSLSDRILFNGRCWNIVAIGEIGRRKGLEIRVVAA